MVILAFFEVISHIENVFHQFSFLHPLQVYILLKITSILEYSLFISQIHSCSSHASYLQTPISLLTQNYNIDLFCKISRLPILKVLTFSQRDPVFKSKNSSASKKNEFRGQDQQFLFVKLINGGQLKGNFFVLIYNILIGEMKLVHKKRKFYELADVQNSYSIYRMEVEGRDQRSQKKERRNSSGDQQKIEKYAEQLLFFEQKGSKENVMGSDFQKLNCFAGNYDFIFMEPETFESDYQTTQYQIWPYQHNNSQLDSKESAKKSAQLEHYQNYSWENSPNVYYCSNIE